MNPKKLTPDQHPFLDLSRHRRAEEYQPTAREWLEWWIGGLVLAALFVIGAIGIGLFSH